MHEHDENCAHGSCRKPDIEYPCPWNFTIIGADGDGIRQAVKEVMGDGEYTLVASRESSSGRYVSLKLTTTVASEEQRYEIDSRLRGHSTVKIVM